MDIYQESDPSTANTHSPCETYLNTYPPQSQEQIETTKQNRSYPRTINNGKIDPESVTNERSKDDEISEEKKKKWTRFQKFTIVTMSLVNFASAASFSVISPFFPKEAGKKGASTLEIGLIFGVYELVIFITAPFFGKFIPKLGCKFMFVSGVFVGGICSILFGFLDQCPDGIVYVVMCFLTRIIEALGCSMFTTASFAIIAGEFPNEVAIVFGLLETFNGFGFMVGPPLGGALYEAAGYKLPFMVMGGFLVLCAVAAFFFLPKPDDQLPHTGSMTRLLSIPSILLSCLTICMAAAALGFLDPTYAGHLDDQFSLTPFWIGMMFLIGPGIYALSAPVLGNLVDKKGWTKSMMCAGCFVTALSYILLGPSPLASFIDTELWIAIVAQIIMGIGIGLALVPTFQDIIEAAKENGLPDNFDTYGLISGLFNSCFSFGAFLGPTAGGYLNGAYGFDWATTVLSFSLVFSGSFFMVYWVCKRCSARVDIYQGTDDERSPLLRENQDITTKYAKETE